MKTFFLETTLFEGGMNRHFAKECSAVEIPRAGDCIQTAGLPAVPVVRLVIFTDETPPLATIILGKSAEELLEAGFKEITVTNS